MLFTVFYSTRWPSQDVHPELQEAQLKLPRFPGASPSNCSAHHHPACRGGDQPYSDSRQTRDGSPSLPPSRGQGPEQPVSHVQGLLLLTIRWADILHTFNVKRIQRHEVNPLHPPVPSLRGHLATSSMIPGSDFVVVVVS